VTETLFLTSDDVAGLATPALTRAKLSSAACRNRVPADSSEIYDFRDTRNLRFLGTT